MPAERKACCHFANMLIGLDGANRAHIRRKKLQNGQKMHFSQKAPGVSGLIYTLHFTPPNLMVTGLIWSPC